MSPGSATSLTASDIQIGAVEIKNSTDDTRATVGANGLHVDVQSSVLPSGASTSANQTTGNSSLSSIDGKVPVLGQALAASSIPVILPSATIATLTPPAAITGFATSAKQLADNHNVVVTSAPTTAVTGTFYQATQPVSLTTLPAGSAAIGKLTANSGVDIGDVDILSIAAGANVIGKVGHDITGIGHGVTVVTTAGTDVALAGSTACKRVTIQSQSDNTGWIAVGAAGVDATEATGTGILLGAGDAYELEIDNLADIFIDSTVNGEGVRYSYFS